MSRGLQKKSGNSFWEVTAFFNTSLLDSNALVECDYYLLIELFEWIFGKVVTSYILKDLTGNSLLVFHSNAVTSNEKPVVTW
jgi:hypothetical protein